MATVKKPVHVHTDQRRSIHEANFVDEGCAYTSFVVTESLPLGNHYHLNKYEVFVIKKGGGVLYTCDVHVNKDAVGQTREQTIAVGDVIFVPAGEAHTFVLEPGTEMACFSSRAFDPDDDDLVSYKLI